MNTDPKELAKRYEPKEVQVLKPDRQMSMVRISPCGKRLVAACTDGTVRRWNLEDEKIPELPPLTGHGGWVTGIALAPSADRLYACDSWGAVRAWSYQDEPKELWC